MQRSRTLAADLSLPLMSDMDAAPEGFLLRYDQSGVLHMEDTRSHLSLSVSFDSGARAFRRRQHVGAEMLVKAVGGRKAEGRRIVDATAGLGGDAMVLATAGFQVIMIERSPVVAALLGDALARARASDDSALRQAVSAMQLHVADATEWLREHRSDIICLDPMFPPRRKSAQVRKEMALLGRLLPADDREEALLEQALRAADHRVVVKRPRLAPCLAGAQPDWQLNGRSSRFDVYSALTRHSDMIRS